MMQNTGIVFQQKNKFFVDPPPEPFLTKAETGATTNYFNQDYYHELFNFQPTNMGTRVRITENIKMDP